MKAQGNALGSKFQPLGGKQLLFLPPKLKDAAPPSLESVRYTSHWSVFIENRRFKGDSARDYQSAPGPAFFVVPRPPRGGLLLFDRLLS